MNDGVERTMTELKPCPFCGGEPEVIGWKWEDMTEHRVRCLTVNCPVNPRTPIYDTEAEAIDAWNTRAERTCQDMDGWCSECAKYLMNSGYAYCPHCGARVEVEE